MSLAKRDPVFIGEITAPGLREGPITVHIEIPDAPCPTCKHPASVHTDGYWDDGVMIGNCTACSCIDTRIEAAGWTPPGDCAERCR